MKEKFEGVFFPESASTAASEVDGLFLYSVLFTVFFAGLIFSLVFFFAVKYRRRDESERPRAVEVTLRLEDEGEIRRLIEVAP